MFIAQRVPDVELETGAQQLLLFLNEPKSYPTLNLKLMHYTS